MATRGSYVDYGRIFGGIPKMLVSQEIDDF